MSKIDALIKHLDLNTKEEESYVVWDGSDELQFGQQEYLVLNYVEMCERVENEISESVWAFNAKFLERYFEEYLNCKYIHVIQGMMGEDCNKLFKELLIKDGNWKRFIEDATETDGCGHFLSHYDGQEHIVTIENIDYYIYRTN